MRERFSGSDVSVAFHDFAPLIMERLLHGRNIIRARHEEIWSRGVVALYDQTADAPDDIVGGK